MFFPPGEWLHLGSVVVGQDGNGVWPVVVWLLVNDGQHRRQDHDGQEDGDEDEDATDVMHSGRKRQQPVKELLWPKKQGRTAFFTFYFSSQNTIAEFNRILKLA